MRRMQKKVLLTLLLLVTSALIFFYYVFVHSGFGTEHPITAQHVHGFRPAGPNAFIDLKNDESLDSIQNQLGHFEHQDFIDRLVKHFKALTNAPVPTRRQPRIVHRFPDGESVSVAPDEPDDKQPAPPHTLEAAEEAYANAASDLTAICEPHSRFGPKGDGGWRVCMAGPYRPLKGTCLSFSFGVGDIWSYDDQVAERLGCRVLTFDPSLTKKVNHTRPSGVQFFRLGLYSHRGKLPGTDWPVDTLEGHINTLAGGPRVALDLLKLDIETAEWPSLEVALDSGTLQSRVKQLMLEVHSREARPHPNNDTELKDYTYYLDIMYRLRQAGFQMWRSEPNGEGWFYSRVGDRKKRLCCYNIYYINTRYLPVVNTSHALLEDRLLLDMHSVRLRVPLKLPDPRAHRSKPEMAENLYFDLIPAIHADCPDWHRIGPQGDSGYDVCLSEPYALVKKSCIVYSFGVGDQYGFEDQLAGPEFGCHVRMFDPSLTQLGEHKRGPRQWVHLMGLGAADGFRGDGWRMSTLQTLLRRFGHEADVIDLLKIDIEFDEWGSLDTAISDGSLSKVKQLIIETHTKELIDQTTQPADYLSFVSLWLRLYTVGFRQWHCKENKRTHFISPNGQQRACCHEHSLINIKFM